MPDSVQDSDLPAADDIPVRPHSTRRLEGDRLIWTYVGFEARLERGER